MRTLIYGVVALATAQIGTPAGSSAEPVSPIGLDFQRGACVPVVRMPGMEINPAELRRYRMTIVPPDVSRAEKMPIDWRIPCFQATKPPALPR